jgi:hypothetical protein
MQIAAVEAFLLSCPLPEPLILPFWGGERTILKRDAMLVRVTTDPARLPGHPVQRRVVEHHRHRVGGGVHVGLDVPVAEPDRPGERLGGVLVAPGGAAPVGEGQRCRRVEIGEVPDHPASMPGRGGRRMAGGRHFHPADGEPEGQ